MTCGGEPLAHVEVRCGRLTAQTDRDGRYRIDLPRPGRYTALVALPGQVPPPEGVAVDGSGESVVDFELHAGVVEGRILDRGGNPVAGGQLYLGDAHGSRARGSCRSRGEEAPRPPLVTRAPDGAFRFDHVAPGDWIAEFYDDDRRWIPAQSALFTVAPGGRVSGLALVTAPRGEVGARVVSPTGAQVRRGALVRLLDLVTGEEHWATVHGDGEVLLGLAAGRYRAAACWSWLPHEALPEAFGVDLEVAGPWDHEREAIVVPLWQ